MSPEDHLIRTLNPTGLARLQGYAFWERGYSAEVFTGSTGLALKLYDAHFGGDTTLFKFGILRAEAQPRFPAHRSETLSFWGTLRPSLQRGTLRARAGLSR